MPLSHLAQYCLDGALEHHEITPDIYVGCLVGNIDVDRLHDMVEDSNGDFRLIWGDVLGQAVSQWWNTAALPGEKAVVMARSMAGFGAHMTEGARYIGEVIAYSHAKAHGEDLLMADAIIAEGLADVQDPADAFTPAVIERTIRHRMEKWLPHFRTMATRAHAICGATETAIEQVLAAERERHASRVEHMRLELGIGSSRQALSLPRRERKRIRKVMTRSAAIGEKVVGKGAVRAILKGDEIAVEGTRYDYRVTRRASLVEQSANPSRLQHPFLVSIHRKGDGERLANGCVYFEDTPAIDQLVALALHVRDREAELDLLKVTNLSFQTPAFYEDETLPALRPRPVVTEEGRKIPIIPGMPDRSALAEVRRREAIDNAIPAIMEAFGRLSGAPGTFSRMCAYAGDYGATAAQIVDAGRAFHMLNPRQVSVTQLDSVSAF